MINFFNMQPLLSTNNVIFLQFNNVKRRSMILTNAKGKPTLEIYRPPGE